MLVFSSPSPLSNVQSEMSACTDLKWLQSCSFLINESLTEVWELRSHIKIAVTHPG